MLLPHAAIVKVISRLYPGKHFVMYEFLCSYASTKYLSINTHIQVWNTQDIVTYV